MSSRNWIEPPTQRVLRSVVLGLMLKLGHDPSHVLRINGNDDTPEDEMPALLAGKVEENFEGIGVRAMRAVEIQAASGGTSG